MPIALITHAACLDHDTGAGHPERPDRLRWVLDALSAAAFPQLVRETAPRADFAQLARVHEDAYLRDLLGLAIAPGEHRALDGDTILSHGSVEAALRAAGAAILAVDLVMEGRVQAAFAAVRPPGHHARAGQAMGFCVLNNVAVAAHHARDRWGLRRIAVADFDVHHGNGTQEMFWDDPDLFFASSHQSPCYPGTGDGEERGAADNVANAPLSPGSGGLAFRRAWRDHLLPAVDAFAPELVIVSAGFDAHRRDPLAQMMLDADDFAWLTQALNGLARRHAQGRIVSLLEGGYDLEALADSAAAHVRVLDGQL
jgi:acetoin utilization deacetylase AcuC-like enzyme